MAKKQQDAEEIKQMKERARRKAELSNLEPIDFNTFEQVVLKWLLLPDLGIIRLLPAVVIANTLPGKPIWMFLKGASGGGKTALLDAMCDLEIIYPISLITPNTFLSGFMGDSSLLPKIDGKILLFKDWTNISSQNRDDVKEIMGQLRDIYDGHTRRDLGNGRHIEWGPGGKIGLIAATTPVIDVSQQTFATLGERFIHYSMKTPERTAVAKRCLENEPKQQLMEKELRDGFYSMMKGIKIPENLPEIPEEAKVELIKLANFCTLARSGLIRGKFRQQVIFVPAPEMPTRIIQQLHKIAVSLMILRGEYSKEDMSIVYRVALDSIPQTNYMVIKQMAYKDEQSTKDIAQKLDYPTDTIRTYLENLAMLGVCKRIKGTDSEEGGAADRWILREEFSEIVRMYENIIQEKGLGEMTKEEMIDEINNQEGLNFQG